MLLERVMGKLIAHICSLADILYNRQYESETENTLGEKQE